MSQQLNNNNPPIPPPRRLRSSGSGNLEIESAVHIKNPDIERTLSVSTSSLLVHQLELFDKNTKTNGTYRPNRVSEITNPTTHNREKILRRSMSTQSYVTNNLLDKITLEATMLSIFNASYNPEDALQCNDGSTNVLPNSRIDKNMGASCHELVGSENLSNINLYPNEKFHSSNGTSNQSQMKDNYLDWSMNAFKSMCSVDSSEFSFSKNSDANNATAINDIESFVKENRIDAKDVIDLLQYEFGDNIYCQHLPSQDKDLIQLLGNTIKEENLMQLIDAEKTLKFQHQTMEETILSQEKNLLIPVHHKKINQITRERRDSAIDELSSWFVRPVNIDEQ